MTLRIDTRHFTSDRMLTFSIHLVTWTTYNTHESPRRVRHHEKAFNLVNLISAKLFTVALCPDNAASAKKSQSKISIAQIEFRSGSDSFGIWDKSQSRFQLVPTFIKDRSKNSLSFQLIQFSYNFRSVVRIHYPHQ